MRPKLTKHTSIQSFKNYYWLKTELQTFCRENGISVTGSKQEIADRIEAFLKTGEIKSPIRKPSVKRNIQLLEELSLDTVITENHRCSQSVRAFFKTVIPKFHFSTFIQDYFKNNIGKTYQDVVDAWYEEEERKKAPTYTKKIAPQFEYNQFTRDFFADPKNRGKSRTDAIEAWKKIKKLPGSNKYVSDNEC
ncbi:SAP domain-containing protein [Metabacillus halosaccharovorans]|uniref:SAP domain-containing protein n=1 Tax=Metabacillus halosaccharovorans TaxID=930124 RepID=A0ABT3DEY2_9BACI|nr:SAP domain-containing protein [Metabacillus halosaccharovorans]MCV9885630.1 SAP domain-containing protein [Metabacillus halosaccharovorans]